jgi:hypothetical protein
MIAQMEFIAKNIGKIALTIFGFLAVFDVVGALVSFFMNIFDEASPAVVYTVWFVLAVFCGVLSYITAIDMPAPKAPGSAAKAGLLAIAVTFVMTAAISIGAYLRWWRYGMEEGYWVPDNEPLTLMFFVTVLLTCVFMHKALPPGK